MNTIPKFIITIGVVLIVVGILWQLFGRFIPLGKLPGDIVIKGENTSFYDQEDVVEPSDHSTLDVREEKTVGAYAPLTMKVVLERLYLVRRSNR